jgi:hypothetical protein
MNILFLKIYPSMYVGSSCDLFIKFMEIQYLKPQFGASLIIWANDQHCPCYN